MGVVLTCAALGGIVQGFAAIWPLVVVSSGFVSWQYASVHVALLVILLGAIVNVVLFTRAAALHRFALTSLMAVSRSRSAFVVGNIVYMAVGS
jgi:hypothetical protein